MPNSQPFEDYDELCLAADSDDSEVSALAFARIERLADVRTDQLTVLTDLTIGRTNTGLPATEVMRLAAIRILGKVQPHQISGTNVFAVLTDRLQNEPSSMVREALIQTAANLWSGAEAAAQRDVILCLQRISADTASGSRNPKERRLAKLALERFTAITVQKNLGVLGNGIPRQGTSNFGGAGERIG
jgi:hypothetical protein